jgi:branched-subunit amino acid aminotransferase/4-amino-4-deoxychorismate lyase
MSDFIWLNGQYLSRKEARIGIFESGLLYGYGIFETILVYSGKAMFLSEHHERLKTSARFIRMALDISIKSLQTAVNRLVNLNNIKHGFIRIVVSSSEEVKKAMKFGSSRPGRVCGLLTGSPQAASKESPKSESYHTSMILIETGLVPDEYEKSRLIGISIFIYPNRRSSETPFYRHKTLGYLENILARRLAHKHKCLEAIFTNTNNYIMEGTRSSLFIVKDRKIFTPSLEANILSGITRRIVIGLCTKNALKVREKLFHKEEIFSADEVFLVSSLMEIMPVINCKIEKNNTIENKIISNGSVGQITKLLQISYRDLLGGI